MRTDPGQVAGYCPMGCGQTLFLGEGGYVTCSYIHCPRPSAVAEILTDREPDHLVELGESTFTIRHPLRERLDDDLLTCDLHDHLTNLDGPPRLPGWYRAKNIDGTWFWLAAAAPRGGVKVDMPTTDCREMRVVTVMYRLDLICCGRTDGHVVRRTWQEADDFRNSYTSGHAVDPHGFSGSGFDGHQRAAILTEDFRHQRECNGYLGWNDPCPLGGDR